LLESSGVQWQAPIRIPWGKQQVLVCGHLCST
jgi:hypothetical protein